MGDYVWTNAIDMFKFHTLGNAVDFGDLNFKRRMEQVCIITNKAMYCGGYRQNF